MAAPLAGVLAGAAPRVAQFGRGALSSARTALFGTTGRAATTGTLAGFEVAGIVPDRLADVAPGGARTVVIAVLAAISAFVLPEVLDNA